MEGLAGVDWWWLIALMLLVRGLGLDMIGVARMGSAIRELHAARRELARLAVIEERERLSRDLHDLLGQTLSMITLKSELARHLVTEEPDAVRRNSPRLSAWHVRRCARCVRRWPGTGSRARERTGGGATTPGSGGDRATRSNRIQEVLPPDGRRRARLDGARRGHQRHPPQSRAAVPHST